MADLAIAKIPNQDERLCSEMADELDRAAAQARAGELCGVILVKIRADNQFAVSNHGIIRRTHAMGFLAQALHDLAAAE